MIIFTAIFSKIFVHRQVSVRHWLGIFTIIIGLGTIGVSDLLSSSDTKTANGIILGKNIFKYWVIIVFTIHINWKIYNDNILFLGDSLIFFAQIITAAQMVYEEKYVVSNDIPPLQAVGWEGI